MPANHCPVSGHRTAPPPQRWCNTASARAANLHPPRHLSPVPAMRPLISPASQKSPGLPSSPHVRLSLPARKNRSRPRHSSKSQPRLEHSLPSRKTSCLLAAHSSAAEQAQALFALSQLHKTCCLQGGAQNNSGEQSYCPGCLLSRKAWLSNELCAVQLLSSARGES